MKDLPAIFQKCGCKNVRTYIQSGNVVFDCPAGVDKLDEKLGTGIEKKFGFRPQMIFRSQADLEKIAKSNPFFKAGESEVHVVFLEKAPAPEEMAKFEEKRAPEEQLLLRGNDIYFSLPNGAGNSKMAGVKMKTLATSRNWRTLNKLIEMMKAE